MKVNDVKIRLAKKTEVKGKELSPGTVVRIGDVIGEDGVWDIERKGKVVATAILHRAVQQLAEITGITVKEEKVLSYPSLENRMHTMWQFEVELKVLNDKGEATGETKTAKEIGVGTGDDNAGSEYMARKRAFDRAVLDVLGLYDVYSDIEAEQFSEGNGDKPVKLEDLDVKERNKIGSVITLINGCKTVEDLKTLGATLKEKVAETDASEQAINVVRAMYQSKLKKLEALEKVADEPVL